MTKMDRDGNNTVDFEEFYYWCACHLKNFCVCCGAALLAPCPLPLVALIRALSPQVRTGDGEEGGAAEFTAEDV